MVSTNNRISETPIYIPKHILFFISPNEINNGNNIEIYLGRPLNVPDETGIMKQRKANRRYDARIFFFHAIYNTIPAKINDPNSKSEIHHSNCR